MRGIAWGRATNEFKQNGLSAMRGEFRAKYKGPPDRAQSLAARSDTSRTMGLKVTIVAESGDKQYTGPRLGLLQDIKCN